MLVQLSRSCSREPMQFVLRSSEVILVVRHQSELLRRVSIHLEYNRLHEVSGCAYTVLFLTRCRTEYILMLRVHLEFAVNIPTLCSGRAVLECMKS